MSVGEGEKGTTNVPEAIGIYPRGGEIGHDVIFGERVICIPCRPLLRYASVCQLVFRA